MQENPTALTLRLLSFCRGWSSVFYAKGDKKGSTEAKRLHSIERIRPALIIAATQIPVAHFTVRNLPQPKNYSTAACADVRAYAIVATLDLTEIIIYSSVCVCT